MGKEEEDIVDILANLNRARADKCIEKLPELLQRKRYELLFDAQIEALKNCGLEEAICSQLRERKEEVVGKAIEMKIPADNYPFFPNLGKSINWLTRRTISYNSSAIVNIDLKDIIDVVTVPKCKYTLNINDGYDLRSLSCDGAIEKACKDPFLTLGELLTLRIITHHLAEGLFRWSCSDEMAALGSRVGDKGYPDLYSVGADLTESCIDCLLPGESRSFPNCEARI
jgi:hypothetical protein